MIKVFDDVLIKSFSVENLDESDNQSRGNLLIYILNLLKKKIFNIKH